MSPSARSRSPIWFTSSPVCRSAFRVWRGVSRSGHRGGPHGSGGGAMGVARHAEDGIDGRSEPDSSERVEIFSNT